MIRITQFKFQLEAQFLTHLVLIDPVLSALVSIEGILLILFRYFGSAQSQPLPASKALALD